jgi:FkbM family methyltransferase
MNRRRNVTTIDNIIGILSCFYVNIYAAYKYRRAYRNYSHVIAQILKNRYPINAVIRRTGRIITLKSHAEAYYIASLIVNDIQYDLDSDSVTLTLANEHSLVMYGAIHNGDVTAIFKGDIYHKLPIKGMTVIDVGANIGDSSVYFALMGAKKVVGIEPFPNNYQMAKKNIELNNLSDKVILLLAGCSSQSGNIAIDPSYESCANSQLNGTIESATRVPLMTLEEILTQFNLLNEEVILKMDCEGCEYDLLLSSGDVLRKFSHVLIEYHYGYKDLTEKLERSGFIVHQTRPVYEPTHKYMKGYISARRS